jgi:hypothetical protein
MDADTDMTVESASMAILTTASASVVHKKDPTSDLFDEVEGQNLGVEVADGHVIKSSITGKIQLDMLDDNGNPLDAI